MAVLIRDVGNISDTRIILLFSDVCWKPVGTGVRLYMSRVRGKTGSPDNSDVHKDILKTHPCNKEKNILIILSFQPIFQEIEICFRTLIKWEVKTRYFPLFEADQNGRE